MYGSLKGSGSAGPYMHFVVCARLLLIVDESGILRRNTFIMGEIQRSVEHP